MEKETTTIIWHAPEYEHTEHSRDWYIALSIIGISVCTASFILENYLFGVLIVIALLAIVLLSKRPPQTIAFSIDSHGIHAGEKSYLDSDMAGFFVEHRNETEGRLLLRSKNKIKPLIIIPLLDVDPENVSVTLKKKNIPEEELSESLLEILMHYLGI
jgi:hypothetical protein